MTKKALSIDREILSKYPEVAIGYVVMDNLHLLSEAKISDDVKNLSVKGISENQLTLQNMVEFSTLKAWRNIYQDCGVKSKTFKSSIESLLRRFIQNDYKGIIPIVDLYNYVSAGFILSVGGYDLQKVEGVMSLRFARQEDRFIPLNGKDDIAITPQHIIYADENQEAPVICWMWNHKDCKRTMLTSEVTRGLFIFDCITKEDRRRLNEAQTMLTESLASIGAQTIAIGILDNQNPTVYF